MTTEEWRNSEKAIKRSHKRYAHFDFRTDITKAWDYISCPGNIAKHSFYPFIHYTKDMSKYTNAHKLKEKKREICYASHRDSCIYQYYCFMLDELYKARVRADGINDVAVAYRTDLGLSNIELAKKAFDFIRSCDSCYVMIGDFTKFFDRLDHQYLKERWNDLLGTLKLPDDHYAVYKNITRFSYWELYDLLLLNDLPCNQDGKRQLNKLNRVLTTEQFRQNRSHIHRNPETFGIPQGSPISALLANMYMLSVDKEISSYVRCHSGLYMRYSDDFIVVLPSIKHDDAKRAFSHIIDVFNGIKGLELQHDKTQFFKSDCNGLSNCGQGFFDLADCAHRFANFLGFTYDGQKVSVRSKTISKYYYRMRRKAKTILRRKISGENARPIGCRNLYKLYSERGSYGKTGNFLTYVHRAESSFGSDEHIGRDTQRHMQKIRKAITKPRTKD